MNDHLKSFANHSAYSATESLLIKPNVSLCVQENEIHYNPIETRLVAKFNVTSTSTATQIMGSSATSRFSKIWIDNVKQQSVVDTYTFSTTGTHVVKYELANPTTSGDYSFSDCTSLTSISIPNSVTTIGNSSFERCTSLASITIPDNLTTIGDLAFYHCSSLTSITIPNSVTSIGGVAFLGCSSLIGTITIPNGVTIINPDTFNGCSGLTSVTIGNGVTSIGYNAFDSCRSLTSVIIGNSVTSIGYQTFISCTNLDSITCLCSTAPSISNETFYKVKSNGTLYVPTDSNYSAWMSSDNYYLGSYNWTKVEQ